MPRSRLLDQVRAEIRLRHYSLRTEQVYTHWIRRYVLFHDKRHPSTMGEREITAFLTDLAVNRHVSASTQNQALSAILCLYRNVFHMQLEWLDDVVRAKRSQRLPVILSRDELRRLLGCMHGVNGLIARLLYGTGMRKMECLRLRVQDVDFHYRQIVVRSGNGNKDRVTMLPDSLLEPLQEQFAAARHIHSNDLQGVTARSPCPMRWNASIRTRANSGAGSMCSRQPGVASTLTPA